MQHIFDCPLAGKLGEMMMETSIIQLILIQMHLLFKDQASIRPVAVSKKDMEVVQALKEYLAATFLQGHSMMGLAKHFGTNTNKLMSQFKKLFGKSIFEYIAELRMEYARRRLLEEDMMVSEVAHLLGYKNPNHFSAAFKKRFGIMPSEVKISYKTNTYQGHHFEMTTSY